jgi:two-component system, OmpR family, sensor histidine kinase BaeS
VPVTTLFGRAAARHEAVLGDKSITLETRVAPGAETVDGDPLRLEQAVQNLVANAARHTPQGGRITLTAEPADTAHVTLRVEDTGAGIPPEHLSKVFERFYRVDAARDHASGGSGLGLSIVRAIVERHGGRVIASSPAGGGARFELVLQKFEL